MSAFGSCLLLLGVLCSLAAASVASLKDEAALGVFLGKQTAVLVEFFDAKEGTALPDDLRDAAKALESGDVVAVARIAGTEAVGEKYEVSSFPAIKFFAWSKSHGDEFDGDRGEEGSAKAIADYARRTLHDAQDQGVIKDADELEELRSSRRDRLCFKAEGLCAIYLADGAPSKDEIRRLAKLKKKNMSKLAHGANARGTTFNWSWLDATKEDGFKALLNGDPPELPSMVLYNPHKRPRYIALEEGTAATEDSMQALLDKVLGGDARFTPAKGKKLPQFAGKKEL